MAGALRRPDEPDQQRENADDQQAGFHGRLL
jgi:hypothetical protein